MDPVERGRCCREVERRLAQLGVLERNDADLHAVANRAREVAREILVRLDRDDGSAPRSRRRRVACPVPGRPRARSSQPETTALDEDLVHALRVARTGAIVGLRIRAEDAPALLAIDQVRGHQSQGGGW